MEAIKIQDRVAPIARSPLDSARGRRRCYGTYRHEDANDRLYEFIRIMQIQEQKKQIIQQSK